MLSDVIKLLPDSVANQIAAGEVIQRPASVIKELVENAIDAGADNIQIILKDAGRTLIQVIDNGCGMSPTDARMAFERHATSKIARADDLYALHTMGFRGEALASIAAVAQIDMRTMRRDDAIGTRLLISESHFESQDACVCLPGTNLMVKNLFFHLPARRKFLKKDSVELTHIMHEFERLALVNPNVDFTISHNDVVMHQLHHGSLRQRIKDLFGKTLDSQLLHVSTETTVVKIDGFISVPQAARKRGFQQFFFVNGRNMRHPYFHKALLSCYADLIASDVQPSYFVNFEVEPDTIDVNIHPQKHEIKFENEQTIWQILVAAIRETLGKANVAGAIDFDTDNAPEIPVFDHNTHTVSTPTIEVDPDYNPFKLESPRPAPTLPFGNHDMRAYVPRDWQRLYDDFATRREAPSQGSAAPGADDIDAILSAHAAKAEGTSVSTLGLDSESTAETEAPVCMQLAGRYIVATSQSGLMLIDQHRAHTRVLYDKYLAAITAAPASAQHLLFPEAITLSPAQSTALSSITDVIANIGFDISFIGDNAWAINGAPALLTAANPADTLMQIIDDVAQCGIEPSDKAILQPIALSMANAAAIPYGRSLSTQEMDALIADLFRCHEPALTPDGHTIMSIISDADIQKLFA